MASAPKESPKPPLPKSLKPAAGPQGKDSNECSICQEPTDLTTPTLVHEPCGNWFDEECLRMWLAEGGTSKCPMFRKSFIDLGTKKTNIWSLSRADRLKTIAEMGRAKPRPQRYHIRRTFRGALDVLKKEMTGLSVAALTNSIEEEIDTSVYAIYKSRTLGEEELAFAVRDSLDLRRCSKDFEELDDWMSLRELWTVMRIFGGWYWFLLQIDEALHVGVWLPFPSEINVIGSHKELIAAVGLNHYWKRMVDRMPWILSMPITTDILCDHFDALNPTASLESEATKAIEVAGSTGVAHWWVVEFKDEEQGSKIYAVPWPLFNVVTGYHFLAYHNWPQRDRDWTTGWGKDREEQFLSQFISIQAQTPFSMSGRVRNEDFVSVPELGPHVYRFSETMPCAGWVLDKDAALQEEWEKYPLVNFPNSEADRSEGSTMEEQHDSDEYLETLDPRDNFSEAGDVFERSWITNEGNGMRTRSLSL